MALQNPLLPVRQEPEQTLPLAPIFGITPTGVQRIGRNLDNSVSENTRSMYVSAWRTFEQ